jgi:heat shock protein HslJ
MRKLAPVRIVDRGAKYMLVFVLCAVTVASSHAMDVSVLEGRWVLEAVNGKEIARESGEIYFQITGQTIVGYDGCNRFGGELTQPAAIRRTQRGCPPETFVLPLDFSELVPQLSRATVAGDKLSLPLPGGMGLAQFGRSQ